MVVGESLVKIKRWVKVNVGWCAEYDPFTVEDDKKQKRGKYWKNSKVDLIRTSKSVKYFQFSIISFIKSTPKHSIIRLTILAYSFQRE